jgi:hypothetical protein
MKVVVSIKTLKRVGSALVLTLIMTGVALLILSAAMTWSSNTTRQTYRSIQYSRSLAAAEASTEKVISQMTRDYLYGGQRMVTDNMATYRQMIPNTLDSPVWARWEFNDALGNMARNYVQASTSTNYVVLDSAYAGLRGYASTYTVVSHARETSGVLNVTGGVLQELQLARIPIFQFAMYSSGNMEISCGQPFRVTGRVHANKTLYVEPDNSLTFQSDVTAVANILFQRDPLDTRGAPSGSVVYQAAKDTPVPAMTLPIGMSNTPTAIREIIQPPPIGEDPNSPLGQLRYYNESDMIITVTDTGILATSGRVNNFATVIPSNQVAMMVTLTNSFVDARENKTIKPIDINVGLFTIWDQTNGALSVASVYVVDRRTLPGTSLGAVRLVNGRNLPGPRGLTVATALPLYVLGHYNQPDNAFLATTNTTTTQPASLVADAVTILSVNWADSRSALAVASRPALPTTVNAAILTGVVETTLGHYSGGMENFPRFLESWGLGNPLTYNGSMVKMFPSLYATNFWGTSGVYDPPKRNWAYDLSFNDPTKLPPLTPALSKVIRGRWSTVAPDRNAVVFAP